MDRIYSNAIVFIFVAVLVWFPATPADASEEEAPSPISVSSLIEEALGNNPSILSMKHRWEAAKQEVPQARAFDDPQLTLTQWAIPSNFNLFGADETWVGIEQALPFPGKRSLRGRVAEKAAEVDEQNYRAAIRSIMTDVKTTYAQLFLARKMIDLHLEHQALLEEFVEIAQRRYTVGQVPHQDLLKAQMERSKLHRSLLVAEQETISLQTEMNRLLNRPPDSSIGPIEELGARSFPITIDALTAQTLANRPELKAATLTIRQREQAVALAKKNYLPDFTVGVTHWNVHSGANQWQAAVKMNLPWIFQGKYDARAQQTAIEEQRARTDFLALHGATLAQLQDLFTKVKSAEQLIEVYREGVLPQAEQLLESARIGYRAGRVGFLDVIDSERTLRDVQLDYYSALSQFWRRVAELERLVGTELTL